MPDETDRLRRALWAAALESPREIRSFLLDVLEGRSLADAYAENVGPLADFREDMVRYRDASRYFDRLRTSDAVQRMEAP